jgi:hypothetical protein
MQDNTEGWLRFRDSYRHPCGKRKEVGADRRPIRNNSSSHRVGLEGLEAHLLGGDLGMGPMYG